MAMKYFFHYNLNLFWILLSGYIKNALMPLDFTMT